MREQHIRRMDRERERGREEDDTRRGWSYVLMDHKLSNPELDGVGYCQDQEL